MIPFVAAPPGIDPTLLLSIIVGLGLLGGIGMGIKALLERRGLQATAKATNSKAETETATAASILTAAARELIDPLRQELAQERLEHAEEISRERMKVQSLHNELDSALEDLAELRVHLRHALSEIQDYRERVAILEGELTDLRKFKPGS